MIMPPNCVGFQYYNDIQQLCVPLIKYDITFFCYTRVYNDSTRITLCNNAKVINFYYNEGSLYKNYNIDCNPAIIADNFVLHAAMQDDYAIAKVRDNFSINGISFIKQCTNYYETWTFGGEKSNLKLLNFYLSNLDFLKLFMLYFENTAIDIILKFDKNRLIVPESFCKKCEISTKERTVDTGNYHEDFVLKRYYINNSQTYLTRREACCMVYYLYGYSAKEIANIFQISHRSVEVHLYNTKQKLNCHNKNKLRKIVYENNLDLLFNNVVL